MTTTHRPATQDEIRAAQAYSIKYRRKVRFRHFVQEISNPRARNGVSHRQYSEALLREVDGVLGVNHHGKFEPITGTLHTFPDGKTFVADIRIDSPYLP